MGHTDEWLDSLTTKEGWSAGFFAAVSAITLPLGVLLGAVYHKNMGPCSTGFFFLFGAGCLLFAVSVELYAEAIRELHETRGDNDPDSEMVAGIEIAVLMTCAILGGLCFFYLDRYLSKPSRVPDPKQKTEAFQKYATPSSGKPFGNLDQAINKATEETSAPLIVEDEETEDEEAAIAAAWSCLLGVAIDSVPEAIMIGFLTNGGDMTISFAISVAVANFPEAFVFGGKCFKSVGLCRMIGYWTAIFVWTVVLAQITYWFLPVKTDDDATKWTGMFGAVVEGFASGSMFVMVCGVMIPTGVKSFHGRQGKTRPSGLIVLLGFVLGAVIRIVSLKLTGSKELHE